MGIMPEDLQDFSARLDGSLRSNVLHPHFPECRDGGVQNTLQMEPIKSMEPDAKGAWLSKIRPVLRLMICSAIDPVSLLWGDEG